MKPHHLRIAVIAASLAAAPYALAAGDASNPPAGTANKTDRPAASADRPTPIGSDRAHAKSDEKKQLEAQLKKGQPKEYYRQELERLGYKITSVNENDADEVEYEVVKGDQTYEVQISLENGKADKVKVASNVWKSDQTERALKSAKEHPAAPMGNKQARAKSESADMKQAAAPMGDKQARAKSDEKDRLEAQLKKGQPKEYYRQELERLGYKITSVNDRDADHVEYEVVKGDKTYEVQIEFENGKAEKIDVASNVWKSDQTERALKSSKEHSAGSAAPMGDKQARAKSDEAKQLEAQLKKGQPKEYYRQELERLGYKITSVNDREADHVEYEVVKGDKTYEVQIDFDNGKAEKIDVARNVWKSDETERAMESGKKHSGTGPSSSATQGSSSTEKRAAGTPAKKRKID